MRTLQSDRSVHSGRFVWCLRRECDIKSNDGYQAAARHLHAELTRCLHSIQALGTRNETNEAKRKQTGTKVKKQAKKKK